MTVLFALLQSAEHNAAIFLTIAFICGGFLLYFLPAFVGRHKKNAAAILLLNFFLGWTIIGWVGSLVWAVMHEDSQKGA